MKLQGSFQTSHCIILFLSAVVMTTSVSCGFKQKLPRDFKGEAIISGTFMDKVYILSDGKITEIKAIDLLAAQRGSDGNIYAMENE